MKNHNLFSFLKFEICLFTIVIATANLLAWYYDEFLLINFIAILGYLLWHLSSLSVYVNWQLAKELKPDVKLLGVWAYFVERELSRQYRINKSQVKYKNILNQLEVTTKALPDATVLINAKGQIQWANDSAFSLLGVSERDIGAKITTIITLDKFVEYLGKSNKDALILNLSDNKVTLSLKLINYNKNQKLLIARDISQQLQLQQTRRAFVANASHELRTPLTVIAGYLEILQSQDEVYQKNQMPIDNAIEQASRMNFIIDDLLELSKIEQSKIMQSDKEIVNLAELLTLLLNDLEPQIEKKQFKVNANFNSELFIKANKGQIQSLIENLIKNALNHNPENTILDLYWQKDDSGNPVLSVHDNGSGIPNKHLKHVTERFYRVENDNSQMSQGTGLGLAIVKHIVTFHDAELFINSKEGIGTKFVIQFPQNRLAN